MAHNLEFGYRKKKMGGSPGWRQNSFATSMSFQCRTRFRLQVFCMLQRESLCGIMNPILRKVEGRLSNPVRHFSIFLAEQVALSGRSE